MTLIIHHRAIGAFHAFLTPTWPIAPLPTPATAATDQHSSGTEDEEEGKEQPHVHDDIQSLFLSTKSENILEFCFRNCNSNKASLVQKYLIDWAPPTEIIRFLSISHVLMFFPVL